MADTPKTPETPAVTAPIDPETVVASARAAASVGRRTVEGNYLHDRNIIAKPLQSTNDGFFTLKPKSPEVIFRAITHTVNTSKGDSTMRYEQARSQGYTNATVADVLGSVPPSCIRDNGTKIVCGDLIMMKIGRADYQGALKFKDEQALRATRRGSTIEQAKHEIGKAMQETNTPGKLARKLTPFTPSAEELTKEFGGE